jgi:hypothetical protein
MSDIIAALHGLVSVSRSIINSSAISNDEKQALHSTLDGVVAPFRGAVQNAGAVAVQTAQDAPGIASQAVATAIEAASGSIPGGPVVAAMLEPIAAQVAGSVVSHLEDVFARHNQSLIDCFERLIGAGPAAATTQTNHPGANGPSVAHVVYEYDANGNPISQG